VINRVLLLGLTCLLAAAACGGGPPAASSSGKPSGSGAATPAGSAAPSGPVVDEAFCGTIADLESELQAFEAIKVRATNRAKLNTQAGKVAMTIDAISAAAPTDLTDLVDELTAAIDGLTGAAENYATSDTADAAQKRLKKAVTTLHSKITALREAAACST
jgi:hypothetical protein